MYTKLAVAIERRQRGGGGQPQVSKEEKAAGSRDAEMVAVLGFKAAVSGLRGSSRDAEPGFRGSSRGTEPGFRAARDGERAVGGRWQSPRAARRRQGSGAGTWPQGGARPQGGEEKRATRAAVLRARSRVARRRSPASGRRMEADGAEPGREGGQGVEREQQGFGSAGGGAQANATGRRRGSRRGGLVRPASGWRMKADGEAQGEGAGRRPGRRPAEKAATGGGGTRGSVGIRGAVTASGAAAPRAVTASEAAAPNAPPPFFFFFFCVCGWVKNREPPLLSFVCDGCRPKKEKPLSFLGFPSL